MVKRAKRAKGTKGAKGTKRAKGSKKTKRTKRTKRTKKRAKRIRHSFAWATGSRIAARLPPKVFGPILVRYLKLYRQRLAAEKLLEEATPEGSLLHAAFDWDNISASHQHRLFQARHLLRSLDYRFETPDGEMRGRATTISERNLSPGKYFYSALRPSEVLKDAEESCDRAVDRLADQLERLLKRCPRVRKALPILSLAIEQMRAALKDRKKGHKTKKKGSGGKKKRCGSAIPKDLEPFAALPASDLDELLKKGQKSAPELDKDLRPQFELP